MADLFRKIESHTIVVEVIVPTHIPEEGRAQFEDDIASFLFGVDRPRPDLIEALRTRGVSAHALATTLSNDGLRALCPEPDALAFVPGPELMRAAGAAGKAFTEGGAVRLHFDYNAKKGAGASNVLDVRLRVPHGLAQHLSEAATGELVTALFGDCALPANTNDFLAAHGVDLEKFAGEVSPKYLSGELPPTTRVSPTVAKRLNAVGVNVEQYGKLRVVEVMESR